MAILTQILSTAVISYVCITVGLLNTLPSSTVDIFSSENTTLDRVMTYTEISCMGSLPYASSFLVMPIAWLLLNKLGRKLTLILFNLPQVIGWIILVTVNKVEAVLFAMFISGFSGCTFLIIPVLVSEYCEVSIRGAMTCGAMIFYQLGTMISYLFGGYLEYTMIKYVSLIMSATGLCMVCFIRESPLYLIKKGLEEEAVKSIQFYRGLKNNSSEISREVEFIRRIISVEYQNNETPEKQSLKEDAIPPTKLSIWKILAKKPTRSVLIKLLFIEIVSIFQGVVVVQIYAKPLLKVAVPSMSPTLSTVLCAVVIAVSSLISAYLVDTVGRRPLFINASIVTGLCCVILGTQIQLDWGPSWLTAVVMNFYFFFYILGAGTVPYVLVGELFLPETKVFAAAIALEWGFLCNFILLFIFNIIEKSLGLGAIFYLFAISCFTTAVGTAALIPETKGLHFDEIQQKLLKNIK